MNTAWIWFSIGCAAVAAAYCCTGCATHRSSRDIPVVKNFDAARYLGAWHEIARLPQRFERDLVDVSATYGMDGDTLRITNRGFRGGKEKTATAFGHFAGAPDEGAFRITFFWPFYGDYRIIWLSPEYDLALVTGGDRSSLWILSRTPSIPPEKRDELLALAERLGFDTSKLEYP